MECASNTQSLSRTLISPPCISNEGVCKGYNREPPNKKCNGELGLKLQGSVLISWAKHHSTLLLANLLRGTSSDSRKLRPSQLTFYPSPPHSSPSQHLGLPTTIGRTVNPTYHHLQGRRTQRPSVCAAMPGIWLAEAGGGLGWEGQEGIQGQREQTLLTACGEKIQKTDSHLCALTSTCPLASPADAAPSDLKTEHLDQHSLFLGSIQDVLKELGILPRKPTSFLKMFFALDKALLGFSCLLDQSFSVSSQT